MTEPAAEQPTRPHLSRYHAAPDSAEGSRAHPIELHLVGHGKRVLEFGCASGHMTAALREQGCRVVGLEIDAGAAAANEHADEVLVVDLDRDNFVGKLRGQQFDVALLGDVLEHLRDPGAILKAVRELLVPGGYIVLCVPNVAHVDVRLALLTGHFPFNDWGLLDRTHLRFFTKATLDQVVLEAGYVPVETVRLTNAPFETELAPDRNLPQAVLDIALRDPEATTYQFIMKAVIDDGDLAVHQLADRCAHLEERIHQLQVDTELHIAAQLETLRGEVETLRGTNDRLRAELSDSADRAAKSEAAMTALQSTKTFRYTKQIRSVYRSLFVDRRR